MKKKYSLAITLCIFLLKISLSGAQNLVSNCSFEQHDTCPDNEDQIERATGWFMAGGDADYYNSCSSVAEWSVPPQANYQLAASGNAFAGATFFSEMNGSYEVIRTPLSSPLAVGTTYYVSFKVSLCINASKFMNEAINKIGAKFTTGASPLINNSAHVYTNSVIGDTVNWTIISGSFVADSAYTDLFLGIFFDTANVFSAILAPSLIDRAYYFIDDVCVSDNSSEVCSLVGIEEQSNLNAITIFPNPATNKLIVGSSEFGDKKQIEICNIVGKNVLSVTVPSFSSRRRSLEDEAINVSSLPPGIYFITITDEKSNKVTKKFIKL